MLSIGCYCTPCAYHTTFNRCKPAFPLHKALHDSVFPYGRGVSMATDHKELEYSHPIGTSAAHNMSRTYKTNDPPGPTRVLRFPEETFPITRADTCEVRLYAFVVGTVYLLPVGVSRCRLRSLYHTDFFYLACCRQKRYISLPLVDQCCPQTEATCSSGPHYSYRQRCRQQLNQRSRREFSR